MKDKEREASGDRRKRSRSPFKDRSPVKDKEREISGERRGGSEDRKSD